MCNNNNGICGGCGNTYGNNGGWNNCDNNCGCC